MECSRCGKDMTYKSSESTEKPITAIHLQILPQTDDQELLTFWQKQLGKYKIGESYSFCFECWLDSLMGK